MKISQPVKLFLSGVMVLFLIQISGCVSKKEFDQKILAEVDSQEDKVAALRGVQWQLEAYNYRGDWVSNFETERIKIIFNHGTHLNGFSGCNVFSAEYKLRDTQINVSSILSTKKICQSRGDILMQTESHFLGLIEKIATYAVDYQTLILFNEHGKRVLVFMRQAE